MSNPVAAHTFDFFFVYLSTRTGGAPGSGVWSNPIVLFDGNTNPSFNDANSMSAGALVPSDSYGILSYTNDADFIINELSFLGNGAPATPIPVTFPGNTLRPTKGYWNMSQGAWQHGGVFFAAMLDHTGLPVIVTSPDGSSPWTVISGANAPATNSDIAIQQIDNYLFVFAQADNSGNWKIYPFNMSTPGWETPSTVLNLSDFQNLVNNGADSPATWTNGIYKFPNGNFLIFYNGGTPFSEVPKCVLLTGGLTGTWGSPAATSAIAAQYTNSVIDASSTYVHVLNSEITGSTACAVAYSTVDQSGTIVKDITAIPAVIGTGISGVGHPSVQNGMLFVPRDDSADDDNAVWVASIPVTAFVKETLPIPPGETNTIAAASPNGTGTGYMVGDTGSIDGGQPGYTATYIILGVSTNVISTYSWSSPNLGTGYAPGDTGTVNGGSTAAHYQILTVDGSGAVLTLTLTTLGSGYSTGLKTTNRTTGAGSGLEISVNSVFSGVNSIEIDQPGGGYAVANNVGTVPGGSQPGSGTGLTLNITALAPKGPSCAYMMFPNGYSLVPPPPQPSLACPIINTGQIGKPFTAQLQVGGGTPPYTFEII